MNEVLKTIESSLLRHWPLARAVALLAAMASIASVSALAADQVKGGERLQQLSAITTKAEVEALKPGDAVAMACTKCKSIMVHKVNTEKGHIKTMTVGEKHLCAGCKTTIEVVGVQKGAHTEIKHVCKGCGDDSVFCCATKPGSGGTVGMK